MFYWQYLFMIRGNKEQREMKLLLAANKTQIFHFQTFYQNCTSKHKILIYFQFAEVSAVAECLGNLPDTLFDRLTEDDFLQKSHDKGCLVRCYLVAEGRQPLAVLNRCIDASFNNPEWFVSFSHRIQSLCMFNNFILIGLNCHMYLGTRNSDFG